MPVVVSIDQLTHEDFMRILVEPKNAILRQFQRMFQFDGVELIFTQDARKRSPPTPASARPARAASVRRSRKFCST
ncbi:MAG: hypothetical protein R2849_20685 [Thermomicrobiales bacterium]